MPAKKSGKRKMRGGAFLKKLKSAAAGINKFAKDTKILSTGLKLASNAGYGGVASGVAGNVAGQLGYGRKKSVRSGRMRPVF
jgi:hypothetical protein